MIWVIIVGYMVLLLAMGIYAVKSGKAYVVGFWFKRSENPVVYWSAVIMVWMGVVVCLVALLSGLIRWATSR